MALNAIAIACNHKWGSLAPMAFSHMVVRVKYLVDLPAREPWVRRLVWRENIYR